MRKIFLWVFLSGSVVVAAQQPAATPKFSEDVPAIPAVIALKPGYYAFNHVEGSAPPKSAENLVTLDSNAKLPPLVWEVPQEVLINGKPASQLTDKEKQKFLQGKVKRLGQSDLEVKIVHVAPGYPVTFAFPENVKSFSIGDAKVVTAQNVSSGEMLLTAQMRPPGDTTFQAVMKSGDRFIYHIFLTENFVDGDLVICVNKEEVWVCWLKWGAIVGILAVLGYIFRERIKNFKLVQSVIEKIKTK